MNGKLTSSSKLAATMVWIPAAATLLLLVSCATTIPTTDTTPPEVS